jgi:hypothetical protein
VSVTPRTEKAVVAHGRSLRGPKSKLYLPGQEIELPAAEAKSLRAAGFLVDPKVPQVKTGNGPELRRDRRVEIRRS